ncbi:hypothetical protein AN168_11395 [Vibrio splendidus]|uniref:Uncharacterized protein n=7 Tax=Vibrio TaxID=662 RepID=A0A837NRE0_VIBSP|nr:hypothetical protein AN168_11395 [Vibrio splendidus]
MPFLLNVDLAKRVWFARYLPLLTKQEAIMADNKDFQDPFNVFYFLGFLAAFLAIPLLPATLTLIRVFNGYATF